MSASKDYMKEEIFKRASELSASAREPFPASRKVYVEGELQGVRVAMREIELTDTHTEKGIEHNAPIRVYDTSGPYTDPSATIDINKGLPPLREQWISERQDTELLSSISSSYGLQRLKDEKLDGIRFPNLKSPRRALKGGNVSQMHYAKQGIITPEMEYVAIRENMKLANARELDFQHLGQSFGANIPKEITPEFVREEIKRRINENNSILLQTSGFRLKYLSGFAVYQYS